MMKMTMMMIFILSLPPPTLFVYLFASRITQKLLNQFLQNSVKRWHMGRGRTHWILAVIRTTLRQGLGYDRIYSCG